MHTWPVFSVNTVFDRLPLRMLPAPTPAGSCLSYPRCSVISSFSVGTDAALQLSYTVSVTDGQLTLAFTPAVNNAIVAAIAAVHR